MKKRKKLKIIFCIILIAIIVFYVVPSIIIQIIKQNNNITLTERSIPVYDIVDLYNVLQNIQNYNISIEDEAVIYNAKYSFTININEFSESDNYEIEITLNDNKIIDKQQMKSENQYEMDLTEGSNSITINLYKNSSLEQTNEYTIYMIEPYQEQFLDELSTKGVAVHYRDGTMEDYSISKTFLQALGAKYVRAEFLQWSIGKNGEFDYSVYDKWVKDLLNTTDIKILAILDGIPSTIYGKDMKINSEEEINRYVEFFKSVKQQYPELEYYEILNEVNLYSPTYKGAYFTEEEMQWYSKLINALDKEIENDESIKIMTAGTSTPKEDQDDRITSEKFYTYFYNTGGINICNNLAFHPYAMNDVEGLREIIDSHKNLYNSFGGFNYLDITEYGSTILYGTDRTQAIDLVKQTVELEEYGNLMILYNLWTTGESGSYEQFGLLTKDYKPRLSYYAMKNYYENTNGAEYIGTVNIDDNIEAHVFDKDGKPKIILWTKDKQTITDINYENFTAKDIYGNDIENTDGKLNITNSPIYLDNVTTNYFYQAISNTALEKYTEFEEKFVTEIAQVEGLQEKINELKQYMQNIANIDTETETNAKQKMEEHFELGNIILETYQEGSLDTEYVKLSSMLDILNDIGNSFEDLVTVTSKTRNPNLQETKTLIDTVELDLKNNSDIEILYVNKMLEFSKDLYEKSEYINSLEEENDIKTGLIVSKDIHAKYLAEWAMNFTKIYIDQYIEDNPISISYSETELTNEDVIATLDASDINVTNNQGKKTYTFTKNETFTFEYIRRGRNFSIEAKVENIDKEVPVISNIENRQILFEGIVPNISDENLDTITLKKDGQTITYNQGEEIRDTGLYELIVTDKASNQTEIIFKIAEKPEYEYTIKENNISDIKHETTKNQFTKNYITIEEYKIFHDDTELSENDIISTGDKLQLSDGSTYTLIVAGDISKDGKTTAYDLSMLRNYILRTDELDDIEMLAADANCDEKPVGASDYSKIREILLGRE